MKQTCKLSGIVAIAVFINLVSTLIFAQPEFVQHNITNSFIKGADVIAVDIDQDEDMDIIGVNTHTNAEIAWWKNNGFNEFTKVVIRDGLNKVRSVRAEDVNDDQEIDIIAAIYGDNTILYLENNGNEIFTEYVVDSNFVGAHTIDIKDVDNDGHLDILCSGFDFYYHNGEIAWWENDGQNPTGWTKHLISDRFQQSPFIYGEDMDCDNDLDIVACGELNDEILWWENDGNENFDEHMVDSLIDAIHTVIARDVDLDGDMDILAAACMSSQIAWYENDGSQEFIKHPLPYFPGALWLDATDLDNDGDRDLFGAPQGASKLAWWENPGNQQFIKHNINSIFTQSFCVVPAMMDKDNDTDLVAIGYLSNKISWFENKLEDPNLYDHPECVVFDYPRNRYLVSNAASSNIGSIVQVDSLGDVSYFKTGIENPLGMCIVGDTLFVSDANNGLLSFDLNTTEEIFNLPLSTIGNLDGMAYTGNNNLFVIDTYGKIFRVNIQTQAWNYFITSGLTQWTQDCIYDNINNRLLTVGWTAGAPIQAISLEDSAITNFPTTYGYYDGITKDQFGNVYLASHLSPGYIIRYSPELTGDPEVISTGHDEPAGLNYNIQDNILAVPNYGDNSVDFIPIAITNKKEHKENRLNIISIYPNPFSDKIYFDFNLPEGTLVKISIYDILGNKIAELINEELNRGDYSISWNDKNNTNNNIAPGIYFILSNIGNNIQTLKIIKH
ncbi:MAG: VCBS repeat-containing protein [Bacteroidetes bacterium]|nr:VCBS repeat-containing protein [Bacteroidota bacterium]MBL7104794.1 VCBS repeat-containing protein [Bacteroidales bacterium]